MWVLGAFPPIEGRLNGDGCAGRAANGQQIAVAGLLCVVPQHFGEETWKGKSTSNVSLFGIFSSFFFCYHVLELLENVSIDGYKLKPATKPEDWKRFVTIFH